MSRRIAIMGGSYNPVHIGHLMVAQYLAQMCDDIDKVWLMLSPLNPLKVDSAEMASDADRLQMLQIAVNASQGCVEVSDVELSMPRPSYTIDTLHYLTNNYPDTQFCLIIGSDNWNCFDRWRASDEIIREYGLIVYPRPGYTPRPIPKEYEGMVKIVNAPMCEVSSTWLREMLSRGLNVNYFMPSGVSEYIKEHQLYAKKR